MIFHHFRMESVGIQQFMYYVHFPCFYIYNIQVRALQSTWRIHVMPLQITHSFLSPFQYFWQKCSGPIGHPDRDLKYITKEFPAQLICPSVKQSRGLRFWSFDHIFSLSSLKFCWTGWHASWFQSLQTTRIYMFSRNRCQHFMSLTYWPPAQECWRQQDRAFDTICGWVAHGNPAKLIDDDDDDD